MIWNPEMETLPRSQIEKLQSERLRSTVERVYARVPFHKNKMDALNIKPADIKDLRDLPKLHTMKKSDLRDNYPWGLFAVPREEIVRVHASSGTTGKPTVVGYTRQDIATWAELCARALALSGAMPGDVFQNAYGYGLFTGGLGMHYGGEHMGLTVVPMGGGNTARQILLMQDFGTQIYSCTPSYALTVADALQEAKVDRSTLKLRSLVLGAEPWTEAMRQEIEARLKVDAVNIYGLSEVMGPGVSNECVECKNGSHVFEDNFIVEALDPETGNPLSDGQVGELTFTTINKQAFPVIRYRTGDLASVTHEPCKCGRTHARMSRIIGRVDDMLIIRGINVFPSQIEEALIGITQITPHHQIVVTRDGRLDEIEVQVEVNEDYFGAVGSQRFTQHDNEQDDDLVALERHLSHKVYNIIGIQSRVRVKKPGALPRSEGGKLRRVIDNRKEN